MVGSGRRELMKGCLVAVAGFLLTGIPVLPIPLLGVDEGLVLTSGRDCNPMRGRRTGADGRFIPPITGVL
ncbi:MAG TPA: hypothetical protein ENI62_16130 [Gammaproteobacteria bacterium]|nr:hypothetical protein [Gammaproteobacteria bacterium]